MHDADPLRLAVARLFAAPWHDAEPARVERLLARRLALQQRAITSDLLAQPRATAAVRRWLAAASPAALPAGPGAWLPRSTAGAIFLLPARVREEAFWAVGLLAHAELWRTAVRREDVQFLDALIGPATHAVRGWLDNERDPGVTLSTPASLDELGSTPEEIRSRMCAVGADALMRACLASEGRAWFRAARWRMPVGQRQAWRRRVQVQPAALNEWLTNDLIRSQAADWQWVIPEASHVSDAVSTPAPGAIP